MNSYAKHRLATVAPDFGNSAFLARHPLASTSAVGCDFLRVWRSGLNNPDLSSRRVSRCVELCCEALERFADKRSIYY